MDTSTKLILTMTVLVALGTYMVYDLAGNVMIILMEASK